MVGHGVPWLILPVLALIPELDLALRVLDPTVKDSKLVTNFPSIEHLLVWSERDWMRFALSSPAVCFLASLLVDMAAVGIVKLIVRRPRPRPVDDTRLLVLVSADEFSFPSGHCSRATLLVALARYMPVACRTCLVDSLRGLRLMLDLTRVPALAWIATAASSVEASSELAVLWVALGFAVLIGLSRLYLQRHHLSDVLAGFLLGPIEFAACAFAHRSLASFSSPT